LKDIILGIDPGSRNAGFGVISVQGEHLQHIEHGVIRMNPSASLPERLCVLQRELHKVFARHPITETAVEKIFFGKNADSAFKLGHARGVCLLVAAQNGSKVDEYAARLVKKCITGSGAAEKHQVQLLIFNLLRIPGGELAFDATDALSLAVTHARFRETRARLQRMMEGAP
jgi:crossover junction endodeoxyribonuclease RuvC